MSHTTEIYAPTLFDAVLSEAARDEGMAQAAENKKSLLKFAKKGVEDIARNRPSREANADDAARFLVANNISPHALGNASGSLFTDRKVWEWTGRLVKSEREWAHSNLIRVWRLK